MVHIPRELHLPQDKVWVRDNGCSADEATGRLEVKPSETIWHIQDARHAMTVEPDRYTLVGLKHNQLPPIAKIETGGGEGHTEDGRPAADTDVERRGEVADLTLNNRIDDKPSYERLPELPRPPESTDAAAARGVPNAAPQLDGGHPLPLRPDGPANENEPLLGERHDD